MDDMGEAKTREPTLKEFQRWLDGQPRTCRRQDAITVMLEFRDHWWAGNASALEAPADCCEYCDVSGGKKHLTGCPNDKARYDDRPAPRLGFLDPGEARR